jgi:hypothetical protein
MEEQTKLWARKRSTVLSRAIKREYHPPEIHKYGTVLDLTKGFGSRAGETDGGSFAFAPRRG